MMVRLLLYICLFLSISLDIHAQWTVEAESEETAVSMKDGIIDMVAPKGLTLWYNEPLTGDCVIEYDACVVFESSGKAWDRVSDLNCFWKAFDPQHLDDIFAAKDARKGVFVNCYALRLYYLGYGGNYNTTTRFRRYDGNSEAVTNAELRPAILKEYTDANHLLKPNHWYHIKISCQGNRTTYTIDGETIVDFIDNEPWHKGWFGFRTTLSHTKLKGFKVSSGVQEEALNGKTCVSLGGKQIPLHWIGDRTPQIATPQTFGVPFNMGEIMPKKLATLTKEGGEEAPLSAVPLAYWADGSVKWARISKVFCPNTARHDTESTGKSVPEDSNLWKPSIEDFRIVASTTVGQLPYIIDSMRVESEDAVRKCTKICGRLGSFPSILRVYSYNGSPQLKLIHTFVYNGNEAEDFITSLGIEIKVPLRDELYNRHVAFTTTDGKLWTEPVQPLVGRRFLNTNTLADELRGEAVQEQQMRGKRIPPADSFSEKDQALIRDWASWSRFRLSQLNDMSYTIRKQAKPDCSMVGTFAGKRASGLAFVGDMSGGLIAVMKDFWQSYPSTLEVTEACSDSAKMTLWLWSPEAEPMDLRHYDTVAHGLNASYEDVQPGMSTPKGIARTSEIVLLPVSKYPDPDSLLFLSNELTTFPQVACTPDYLHEKKAFGDWGLPVNTHSPSAKLSQDLSVAIEQRLDSLLNIYKTAVEKEHWYGFWNYGDFMHTTDPVRKGWLYDVGGFAWDNTELATNQWLWYSFLRTGRRDIWQMAEAMFRHNSEVDVYHCGPYAGLGTRHNVSHWGCGAKEARISQAWWNRFYYYLTGDERAGELMEELTDADQLLYTLDPMRLAQPREKYPCTAPARLRIGPDWLAYAGNWFAHWERTLDNRYLNKIQAGIKSINSLPNGIFTGQKALGYDPATGIISWEGDPQTMNTNHLLPIMGGFEFVNELQAALPEKGTVSIENKKVKCSQLKRDWHKTWLNFCSEYRDKAWKISKNKFRIPRLAAYAYKHTGEQRYLDSAIEQLMNVRMTEFRRFSTNDAATWSLDAIYLTSLTSEEIAK